MAAATEAYTDRTLQCLDTTSLSTVYRPPSRSHMLERRIPHVALAMVLLYQALGGRRVLEQIVLLQHDLSFVNLVRLVKFEEFETAEETHD